MCLPFHAIERNLLFAPLRIFPSLFPSPTSDVATVTQAGLSYLGFSHCKPFVDISVHCLVSSYSAILRDALHRFLAHVLGTACYFPFCLPLSLCYISEQDTSFRGFPLQHSSCAVVFCGRVFRKQAPWKIALSAKSAVKSIFTVTFPTLIFLIRCRLPYSPPQSEEVEQPRLQLRGIPARPYPPASNLRTAVYFRFYNSKAHYSLFTDLVHFHRDQLEIL